MPGTSCKSRLVPAKLSSATVVWTTRRFTIGVCPTSSWTTSWLRTVVFWTTPFASPLCLAPPCPATLVQMLWSRATTTSPFCTSVPTKSCREALNHILFPSSSRPGSAKMDSLPIESTYWWLLPRSLTSSLRPPTPPWPRRHLYRMCPWTLPGSVHLTSVQAEPWKWSSVRVQRDILVCRANCARRATSAAPLESTSTFASPASATVIRTLAIRRPESVRTANTAQRETIVNTASVEEMPLMAPRMTASLARGRFVMSATEVEPWVVRRIGARARRMRRDLVAKTVAEAPSIWTIKIPRDAPSASAQECRHSVSRDNCTERKSQWTSSMEAMRSWTATTETRTRKSTRTLPATDCPSSTLPWTTTCIGDFHPHSWASNWTRMAPTWPSASKALVPENCGVTMSLSAATD